jgi:hypothetical protein
MLKGFTATKSNKIFLDSWVHVGEKVLMDHHAVRSHVRPTDKVTEHSDRAGFNKSTHSLRNIPI